MVGMNVSIFFCQDHVRYLDHREDERKEVILIEKLYKAYELQISQSS